MGLITNQGLMEEEMRLFTQYLYESIGFQPDKVHSTQKIAEHLRMHLADQKIDLE